MTASAIINEDTGERLHSLELSANISGSVREKEAHLWLHKKGFIVCPCMHPTGPIDVIIFDRKIKKFTAFFIVSLLSPLLPNIKFNPGLIPTFKVSLIP